MGLFLLPDTPRGGLAVDAERLEALAEPAGVILAPGSSGISRFGPHFLYGNSLYRKQGCRYNVYYQRMVRITLMAHV